MRWPGSGPTAVRAVVAAGLAWLLPALAWAHSPVPGLGRFYNGMLHPVLAPAAFIALAALGILIGQHGFVATRRPVLGFVLGLACGLVLGLAVVVVAPGLDADTLLLLVGIAAAVSALAAWHPPAPALLVLASAVGLAAGLGLADMAAVTTGSGRWVVIAGTWLGGAFLALGVAALAELAQRPWQKVALRVGASWLAASALLVLGLRWVGPLPAPSKPPPAAPLKQGAAPGPADGAGASAPASS